MKTLIRPSRRARPEYGWPRGREWVIYTSASASAPAMQSAADQEAVLMGPHPASPACRSPRRCSPSFNYASAGQPLMQSARLRLNWWGRTRDGVPLHDLPRGVHSGDHGSGPRTLGRTSTRNPLAIRFHRAALLPRYSSYAYLEVLKRRRRVPAPIHPARLSLRARSQVVHDLALSA